MYRYLTNRSDYQFYKFFALFLIASILFVPLLVNKPLEILTVTIGLVIVSLNFRNEAVLHFSYILLIINPYLQGRSLFGIYGLNMSNIIFLFILLNFFINYYQNKIKNNISSDVFKWVSILFIFQIIYVFRLIYDNSYYAGNSTALMQELIKPVQIYIFILILHKSISSFKSSKKLIHAILVSMGIQAIVLFWLYFIQNIDPSSQLMWNSLFLGHKNTFSIIIAQLCLFFICFTINKKSKFLLLYIILAIISLIILLYSQSLTTWIGFSFALFFVLIKSKKRFIGPGILGLTIIFVALFYSTISGKIIDALSSLNPDYYYMPTYRLAAWYGQFLGIMKHPIIGGGFQYAQFAHNGYLTVWNKLGIFGLLTSIIIVIKMYKTFSINYLNKANNYKNTLSLFGLSILAMIPIINLTHSFQFIDSNDYGIIIVLFVVYIVVTRKG